MTNTFEFYETPWAFTRYLFSAMEARGIDSDIHGNLCEPCVGSSAIPRAIASAAGGRLVRRWWTSDIDPGWDSGLIGDATDARHWRRLLGSLTRERCDWTVSNPPFTPALAIIEHALAHSRVGVAMHLRASIHEVLKTGVRRTWMAKHQPTGILWLPRFAYQRSPTTGKWTTDSVCACWVVWMHRPGAPQFIEYAPEWVIDSLDDETPAYRERMDLVMGFTGSEAERQAQRKLAA